MKFWRDFSFSLFISFFVGHQWYLGHTAIALGSAVFSVFLCGFLVEERLSEKIGRRDAKG